MSKTTNKVAGLICWSGSLISAYFIQGERDKAAIALPTSAISQGSFRQRFLLPLLPCSIIVWVVIYLIIGKAVVNCWGKKLSESIMEGFPGWSYMINLFHGGIILPLLLVLAVHSHCIESGERVGSGHWLATFFIDGKWESGEALSRIILEQINCAVIGYLLKDFVVSYPSGLDIWFILHHVGAVAGCSLCLYFPSLIGIIAFNTVQCEFASALYCLAILYHSSMLPRLLYILLMTLSILASIAIGILVHNAPIENHFKYSYSFLSVLIVLIRFGGLILQLKDLCCGPSSSVEIAKNEDAVKNEEKDKKGKKNETKKNK
jgi:hypothetical protein